MTPAYAVCMPVVGRRRAGPNSGLLDSICFGKLRSKRPLSKENPTVYRPALMGTGGLMESVDRNSFSSLRVRISPLTFLLDAMGKGNA